MSVICSVHLLCISAHQYVTVLSLLINMSLPCHQSIHSLIMSNCLEPCHYNLLLLSVFQSWLFIYFKYTLLTCPQSCPQTYHQPHIITDVCLNIQVIKVLGICTCPNIQVIKSSYKILLIIHCPFQVKAHHLSKIKSCCCYLSYSQAALTSVLPNISPSYI